MRSQIHGKHCKGLFVRRSMPELDEVIGRSQEIYTPLGATWKAQKTTWIMPNGAMLRLRSLERDADAGKYQGHSYTDVYVDEGGNFPNSDPIDKLNATLRNPHGIPASFNISANPGGPGHEWIKKRYIDPCFAGMQPIIDDASRRTADLYPQQTPRQPTAHGWRPRLHGTTEEVRPTVVSSGVVIGRLERHRRGRAGQSGMV